LAETAAGDDQTLARAAYRPSACTRRPGAGDACSRTTDCGLYDKPVSIEMIEAGLAELPDLLRRCLGLLATRRDALAAI